MAYQNGTATNYRDLLDKLRLFLTTDATLVAAGQEWEQLRWTTTATTQELIVKGPGLAGLDEVFLGFYSKENTASDWFNWELNGFNAYDSGQPFSGQLGRFTHDATLHLWNSTTPYWFVANGRRVIVAVKVYSSYFFTYMGLTTPYCPPSMRPYPLCIRARTNSTMRWSSVAFTYEPSVYIKGGLTTHAATAYPGREQYGPTPGGKYTLYPIQISLPPYLFGEVDGWFRCPGVGNAAENIITAGGVDHLAIHEGPTADLINFNAIRLQ